MADQNIVCKDCGDTFVFRESEQRFYEEKQFTPPKRCKSCRELKKERQTSGGVRARG